MAPAGWAKEVAKLVFERFAFLQVLSYFLPFVYHYMHGMEGAVYRLGNAVVRYLAGQLFCESAEQAVPDNEDHAHIAVEVGDIAGMVHAVVRWGDEYILYPAGQSANGLCMHQYTIYLREGVDKYYVHRPEVEEHQRYEVQVFVERHKYR